MKIISWNVNGIRAIIKKEFFETINVLDPDILCIQETKAQDNEVEKALFPLKGHHLYCNSAEKKGYSGTAILSKSEPIVVSLDMAISDHDSEGRIICAEYADFYLINVYVPNSGQQLDPIALSPPVGYRLSQLFKRKREIKTGNCMW